MIIDDIYVSLLRLCDDFRQEVSAISPTMTFVNFDAHASNNSLPEKDIIGIAQLTVEHNVFVEVKVLFGVGCYEDHNLDRHMKLVARLFEKFLPTTTHPVYNAGITPIRKRGFMKAVDGTQMLPMGDDDGRPVQFVGVAFATDCFKQPQP